MVKLYESKEDIKSFVDKFGKTNYNHFLKSKDKLKKKNKSTSLSYYNKNISKEELEKLISSLYTNDIKESKDDGTPSVNDLKNAQKKHKKSIKKCALGSFERLLNTDPKKNMEIFNHMLGSDKYTNSDTSDESSFEYSSDSSSASSGGESSSGGDEGASGGSV